GVIVLKRLSDAERAGDRVLAVLRGGAVVHNGFTGGITSPSGKAQSRVIHEALDDAGLAPSQVQYLEAHGTGTELGDPMELGAAAAVYGRGRKRDEPLLVGSVKANISHLEAAGGISGLIKTVLCLHHGLIPPQANFEEPSPHVPWQRLPVKVVTESTPWPKTEERVAGVTALGLVGTNAHVIVSRASSTTASDSESEQELNPDSTRETGSNLLVLSARSDDALQELADRYRQFLTAHSDIDVSQVCRAAAIERQHFEHRLALTAENVEDFISKLRDSRLLQSNCGVHDGHVVSQPKIAWVFTDSGTNWDSVARELADTEPVFQDMLARFDARLAQHLKATDRPNLSLADHFASTSVEVNGHQPLPNNFLRFIVQSGLAHIWKAWGSEPDTVLGIGIGQYVAACVAGGLSFEDALLLVVEREKLFDVSSNGPQEQKAGLDQFEEFADSLDFYPPSLQLICSLSGEIVPLHRSLGGSYWREHVTATASPHCFATLNETQCTQVLHLGSDCDIDWHSSESNIVHSLDENRNVRSAMLNALGAMYVVGMNPAFKALNADRPRVHVDLPKYPFQKRRFWITEIPQPDSTADRQEMTVPQGV
ncbi:MAG: type I polyketide synthase, partial [Planctomycetaceae bacterium]|nr:type I polyketide synthase [Planctomycetaceae bacterium]